MTIRKSTFVLIILTMAFLFFIFGYLIAQQMNGSTYSVVSEHEAAASADSAASSSGSADVIKLNINTAASDELAALPGMTAKLAGNIIDYRNTYGNFARVENILRVDGITRDTYSDIEQYLYAG